MDGDAGLLDERFAVNLRAARERAGMSQGDVAECVTQAGIKGFRQQTIVRIESGHRKVGVGEGVALAQAVGSSIEALVRPQGLARDAWLLRDLARGLRAAHEEVATQSREFATLHDRLSHAVTRLEQAGHGKALEVELGVARRALALVLEDGG